MSNESAALRRIEEKLIQGGAKLPVPINANGVEHGLSIALMLVRDEIAALAAPAAAPDVQPAEAIVGFAGFLTCGAGRLTIGECCDASPMANFVEAYRKSQGWPLPRPDFASRLSRWEQAVFPAAPAAAQAQTVADYRGPLRTPAGDPAWIPRDGRQPEQGQRVRVLMDAGSAGNPLHPGYPSGKWEEETEAWNPGGPRGATYACEIAQTGYASHWMPLPAAPTA